MDLHPRVCRLQLSIDELNKGRWRPQKDFDLNRLVAGKLQLAPGTMLLLDETKMDAGKLQPEGVESLKAVGTLVGEQRLSADIGGMEYFFPTELACAVISRSSSLIASAVDVKL